MSGVRVLAHSHLDQPECCLRLREALQRQLAEWIGAYAVAQLGAGAGRDQDFAAGLPRRAGSRSR